MSGRFISRVLPYTERTNTWFISRLLSTEGGSTISEERARKLKALFGVTTATDGQKPLGMPIKPNTPTATAGAGAGKSAQRNDGVISAEGTEGKDGKGEESPEQAWLDSGYIEYMNNQKDKGWKS